MIPRFRSWYERLDVPFVTEMDMQRGEPAPGAMPRGRSGSMSPPVADGRGQGWAGPGPKGLLALTADRRRAGQPSRRLRVTYTPVPPMSDSPMERRHRCRPAVAPIPAAAGSQLDGDRLTPPSV